MATVATTAPSAPRKGLPKWVKSPTFARILFPFVVLGIWYFIYYTLDSRIFPSPQQVAVFMWEEITLTSGVRYSSVAENIYVQFGITLMRLTIGFFIALTQLIVPWSRVPAQRRRRRSGGRGPHHRARPAGGGPASPGDQQRPGLHKGLK